MLGLIALIPLVTHQTEESIQLQKLINSNHLNFFIPEEISFTNYALVIIFIFVLQFSTSVLKAKLSMQFIQNITLDIKETLYESLLKSGYLNLISLDKGKHVQVFQVDVDKYAKGALSIVHLFSTFIFICLLFSFLCFLSVQLSLLLLPIGGIVFITILITNRYIFKTANQLYTSRREEASSLLETWSNIQLITVHRAEQESQNWFKNILLNVKNLYIKHFLYYYMAPSLVKFLIFISLLSLILINQSQSLGIVLSTTALVNYIIILSRIQPIFGSISSDLSNLSTGSAAYEVITKLKNYTPIHSQHIGVKNFELNNQISFNQLSYKYPDKESSCLKNFNDTIKKGECTLITGPSGSGKSTLVHLLLQLYSPNHGSIQIDSQDLTVFSLESFYKQIAFVSQDNEFFNRNLRDNILFGIKENISDSEIIEKAKLCQIEEFIKGQPRGLNSKLYAHGKNLSGGQKKRLSLLRALIRNPRILILDEPSTGLDEKNENELLLTLNKLKGSLTLIIVSHNQKFDQIADHTIKIT